MWLRTKRGEKTSSTFSASTVKANVPDGVSGWLFCISCLIGWLLIGGITTSFGIIGPSLKTHFHLDTTVISLIGTLLIYLSDFLGPFAACLTHRFGLRTVYMAGSILTGVSLIASTFSPDAYLLLLTYGICSGIGISLIKLPISVGCNYYFDKKRALATGMSMTGSSIGAMLFPPLVEFMLQTFNWKTVVFLFATIAFFSCSFAALIRPLEVTHGKNDKENVSRCDEETIITDTANYLNSQRSKIDDTSVDNTNMRQSNFFQRLLTSIDIKFWNDPAVCFFFASRFFGNLSASIFSMLLPIILVAHQFTMMQASLMFTVIGVPNTFSRVIFGAVMDHPRVDCLVLNAISSTMVAIILCIFAFYDAFMVVIILLGLLGVMIAPFQVNTAIALGKLIPLEEVASGYGKCSIAYGVSGIIGPILAGYIFDHTEDHRVVVFLVALGNLLCGVTCLITYFLNVSRKIY